MRATEVQGSGVLSVGISDLIAHRECPRRAAYGARRHLGEGMQDHGIMTPEAGSPATWYGSAIHDVFEHLADGFGDDAAIETAWAKWGQHLEPSALALLREDLAAHHTRDWQNVRTVLSEDEIKVYLTDMPDGRPIYFRGRIDRLYERLDRPGHFVHIDYKSSKWIKSQEEVDDDLQLWAYNWGLCEFLPEIDELEQWLDQLRGGMVCTFKDPEQREQMREWLAVNARNYFLAREDPDALLEDGLPEPSFNQWCPWCPILESCQIIPQLTDWALSRIAALRPGGLELTEAGAAALEATPIDEYLDRYEDVKTAIGVLQRYQDSARALIHDLPDEERRRLGFELRDRRNSVLSVQARDALYNTLGHDRFLELARVTQERLKSLPDKEQREWALSLVEKIPGNKVVHRTRR